MIDKPVCGGDDDSSGDLFVQEQNRRLNLMRLKPPILGLNVNLQTGLISERMMMPMRGSREADPADLEARPGT